MRVVAGTQRPPHGEPDRCFGLQTAQTTSTSCPGVRIAQSISDDAVTAVRQLQRQLYQPRTELVIFSCSGDYDLAAVSDEVNRCFAGSQVVGCTSAGGIGPHGFVGRSLTGISFASNVLKAVSGRIGRLADFDPDEAEALVAVLRERLEIVQPGAVEHNLVAIQMIDGMTAVEEAVTRSFQTSLGAIPLVGGSAGDTGPFGPTYVYEQGRFHEDSAVLLLASISIPFTTFCVHHLTGTDQRGVVTAIAPDGRRVLQIDGLVAAEGYARLFGAQTADLGPQFFASHPVAVRIAGVDYARTVGSVNIDGSLTFQCAMEEGVVLRCAVENDLVTDMAHVFRAVGPGIGRPSAILVFDCVDRSAELSLGLEQCVAGLLRRRNVIGFSTHGAQIRGIHVNQALLGIAFGQEDAA